MKRKLSSHTCFLYWKFSETDAYSMFATAELRPIQRWTNKSAQYSLWLLERPQFSFPLLSNPHILGDTKLTGTYYSTTPFGVPSREEWRNLWAAWDFVTTRMIPPSMLFEKPIDLRHICLFYLGHIPTFLDIQLSKVLQEPSTEPEEFRVSFLFFPYRSKFHLTRINYSAFLRFVPQSCVRIKAILRITPLYSAGLTQTSMIRPNAMWVSRRSWN